MKRKLNLLAIALIPMSLLFAQSSSPYEIHRQRAIEMNELAGHLRSLNDSRKFVEMIAAIFADDLPPQWARGAIRDRLAVAEYQSAIDPRKLIPEQRIVDAWNKYVREIGAPEEALVNVAEIHNLRDAFYVEAQLLWNRGSQNVWTMPDIYAVNANGNLADGCRTIEAVRVVWDLANLFDNLRGARENVRKGIAASDLMRKPREEPTSERAQARVMVFVSDNLVRVAEMRYVREHGASGLNRAIEDLVFDLLPPKTAN
jgi:hypothetical protein